MVAANFGASAFSGAVPSGFTAGWPTGAGGAVIAGSVDETATATETQDATATAAVASAALDGAIVTSAVTSTFLGTDVTR